MWWKFPLTPGRTKPSPKLFSVIFFATEYGIQYNSLGCSSVSTWNPKYFLANHTRPLYLVYKSFRVFKGKRNCHIHQSINTDDQNLPCARQEKAFLDVLNFYMFSVLLIYQVNTKNSNVLKVMMKWHEGNLVVGIRGFLKLVFAFPFSWLHNKWLLRNFKKNNFIGHYMSLKYRISSYKTRGYFFLLGLQLRVLLEIT